jgi:hypothetical protein
MTPQDKFPTDFARTAPTAYARIVKTMPTPIAGSNSQPRLSKKVKTRNRDIEGITNQRILSAKSATCAVSFVSLYNQVIDIILASGSEITIAPNTVVLFAISLAVTITAPENNPLPSRFSQSMRVEVQVSTQV